MAIQAPSTHNVVQCVKFVLPSTNVSVPAYGNNLANFRQWGSTSINITPKFANSHIRIVQNTMTYGVNSHFYLTWKRGGTSGTWMHTDTNAGGSASSDGLFVNHNATYSNYWSAVVIFEDANPSYSLGNSINYVPYVGCWNSRTLHLNNYANNGNGETGFGTHGFLEEIAYT